MDFMNKCSLWVQKILYLQKTIYPIINQKYIFMKQIIAIPTSDNCLCSHFGHCDQFRIIEIENKEIISEISLTPPPHEPGVLPAWLAGKGVTHIIAGGIGNKAITLFNQQNIQVFAGVPEKPAKEIALDFINGTLVTGSNTCDH